VCANKVLGGYIWPAPRDLVLYRFIYMYIQVANSLENLLLMNH